MLITFISFGQTKRIKRLSGRPVYDSTWDLQIIITKKQFDSIIDMTLRRLQDNSITSLTETENSNIIRLLNTSFMYPLTSLRDSTIFQSAPYIALMNMLEKKDYLNTLLKENYDWVISRGMGYYFPKLKLELYGTPYLRSYFDIQ